MSNILKRLCCTTSISSPRMGQQHCCFHHTGLPMADPIRVHTKSASPKPHPSKPRPCNMPQAKTEVALQFSECCAAEVLLQHWPFCNADVILTKSCTAASERLQCNIDKAALQESGAFLPLSCGLQAPTSRHPRLGPADQGGHATTRFSEGFLEGSLKASAS